MRDFEPHLALDGGIDGLDFYRKLFTELGATTSILVCEIGIHQKEPLEALVADIPKATVRFEDDLAGIPRVMVVSA